MVLVCHEGSVRNVGQILALGPSLNTVGQKNGVGEKNGVSWKLWRGSKNSNNKGVDLNVLLFDHTL